MVAKFSPLPELVLAGNALSNVSISSRSLTLSQASSPKTNGCVEAAWPSGRDRFIAARFG